jgi:trehalose-6-phosphate synthase/HAMP domain-containing protein
MKTFAQRSMILRLAVLLSSLVALSFGVLSWQQVEREFRFGIEDLDRRARTTAHRMSPSALEALREADFKFSLTGDLRLEGHRRLLGFAIYRPNGKLLVAGKTVEEYVSALGTAVGKVVGGKEENIELVRLDDAFLHVAVLRLATEDNQVSGILVVAHDASYLDTRLAEGRMRAAFWTLALTVILVLAVVGSTWFVYERPLRRLAEWMQRVRVENAADAPPADLKNTLLASETDRLAASLRAARSSSAVISRESVRSDALWTRERLRAHALDCLENAQLGVVSNREPYMHQMRDGKPEVIVPASGLVTALDPILQACGGFWVAHGAGEADQANSDSNGRLTVPPGDSRYTLKRVWLSREEEQGYYYGFSNEGLWPLCHLAHERPVFRDSDWKHYIEANQRFADAVLEEIGTGKALILVQDYQQALVPIFLKTARPDLKVGLFWHIPWPNAEAFRICPWRVEILKGMLGADLIGFHLQQHCNNFLDSVDRMVEARLDWDHFSADLQGHRTLVRPFPISVQSWADKGGRSPEEVDLQIGRLKEQHHLNGLHLAVGVDRIDYTKGMPERFRAIGHFLEKNPQHRGKFSFVQLGAPSRTHIPRYRELVTKLEGLADEINWRYQKDGWKPIHFLISHHDSDTVHAFLRMSDTCIVSSLHDGMNLVAKEYVAAQEGRGGTLVLSEFAGAAHELTSALIINPYNEAEFAEAIRRAVEMPAEERRRRMDQMRKVVEERNVYRWAGDFISVLSQVNGGSAEGASELPRVATGAYTT